MGGRTRLGFLPTSWVVTVTASVVILSVTDLVGAQSTSEAPTWRLAVGAARYGLSDGLASPLPHRGTGLLLGVGYRVPDHSGGWGLSLAYWAPRVSSAIETDLGGFETTHQVDAGFVWLKRLGGLADGRVGLHLGGAVAGRFSFRSHHYTEWSRQSRVERFGDLFVPLQAAGMWSMPLGEEGLVTHRVGVPVVTLALRSPYTGLKYFPEATVEGPLSFTGFDSRLSYRRKGGGWRFGFFHHMTFVRYPDPRPLSSIVHRVGVEVLR